jgi:hypothetical protein
MGRGQERKKMYFFFFGGKTKKKRLFPGFFPTERVRFFSARNIYVLKLQKITIQTTLENY